MTEEVWLAYRGEYEDRRVVGVYTTQQLAIEAWRRAGENDHIWLRQSKPDVDGPLLINQDADATR